MTVSRSSHFIAIGVGGRSISASSATDITLGREAGCTITLTDDRVSRRHGVLRYETTGWVYTDLASSNGSFVDGRRVARVDVGQVTRVRLGGSDGPEVELTPVGDRDRPLRFAPIAWAAAALFGVLIVGGGVFAMVQPSPHPSAVTSSASASPAKLTRADVAARGRSGTVYIAQGNSHGSGIYLGLGRVLTAAHVVTNGGAVEVSFADAFVGRAQILAIDSDYDLALLSVTGMDRTAAQPLDLGNSATLRQGDEIVAIGYPIDLPLTVKVGVVSGLKRDAGTDLVQTDASVNPGMSGGPLLNEKGEVIGVIDYGSQRYPGLNFAVASTTARVFVDRVSPR